MCDNVKRKCNLEAEIMAATVAKRNTIRPPSNVCAEVRPDSDVVSVVIET